MRPSEADFAKVSNLERRLVAHIRLTDADDEQNRKNRTPTGQGFWSDDFPRMSETALMPDARDAPLLGCFRDIGDSIDCMMQQVCSVP